MFAGKVVPVHCPRCGVGKVIAGETVQCADCGALWTEFIRKGTPFVVGYTNSAQYNFYAEVYTSESEIARKIPVTDMDNKNLLVALSHWERAARALGLMIRCLLDNHENG